MSRFAGKVVVVIGCATGLGRAMAEGFAREGAQLVVADIDAATLDITLQKVIGHGAQAIAVTTDVLKKADLDNLAAKTIAQFGRVDLVCSNAGVNEYVSPAWEKTPADWEWVMGVNLYGLVHAVNAFIPIMIAQGAGHFVSTASNSSLLSASGVAVYVASKKACLGYCEALQYDLLQANYPVKISVILPNKMASDMPNSARNRPAALAGRIPNEQQIAVMSAYLADGGHTPDEASAIALDGIAEQRFYILTMPIDGDHTVEWAHSVQDGHLYQQRIAGVRHDG